jgi:ribosome-binding protein aMBF1 (putative translation factor)
MSFQDWDPVVLRKNTPVVKKEIKTKTKGQETMNTVKKIYDPNDPDAEPEIKPVMVGQSFGMKMRNARCAKQLTQKQLAHALSLPESIIVHYEQGTAVRNGQYIGKIKRYLNITD